MVSNRRYPRLYVVLEVKRELLKKTDGTRPYPFPKKLIGLLKMVCSNTIEQRKKHFVINNTFKSKDTL